MYVLKLRCTSEVVTVRQGFIKCSQSLQMIDVLYFALKQITSILCLPKAQRNITHMYEDEPGW